MNVSVYAGPLLERAGMTGAGVAWGRYGACTFESSIPGTYDLHIARRIYDPFASRLGDPTARRIGDITARRSPE